MNTDSQDREMTPLLMKGSMSGVKLKFTEYSSVVRPLPVKIEIHEWSCVYSSTRRAVYNEESIWGDKPSTFKDDLDNHMGVRSNKILGYN